MNNCKNEKNLKVIGEKILVKKLGQQKFGNLVLIDTTDSHLKGMIVELGPGKRDAQGNLIPFSVKVGETILFSKYKGSEIRFNDENYVVIVEDDIIVIESDN